MRKIVLMLLMALSAAFTAMAVDPSGSLPVMYITTENGTPVTSKDDEVNATCYVDSKGQTVSGTTGSADAQLTMTIAGRGNYSWSGFEKKPYKIKFPSKLDLMGLPKHKNFALMAAADDNLGYLRNVTGFYLSRLLGLDWTPNDIPIEVVLNGDYIGVYYLTETIKVDANRVKVTKQDDMATTDVDGGWLVEIDNYDTDPHVTVVEGLNGSYRDGSGNPYNIWFTYKSPEELSSEQNNYLTEQMSTINNLIYATDKTTCAWADYIDLGQAARYFLVQELMDDYESYHGSCYLHRERGESEKWKFGPVWDFGSALMNDSKPSTIAGDRTGGWHQVWIAEMMKYPAFKSAVKQVWAEFAAAHSIDEIKTYITEQANKIATAMPRDHQRWPNYGTNDEASCANTLISRLTSCYNWCASKYTISASGYTYSILGDFSGSWEDGKTAMTLGADGLWRCTITPSQASGEFGVRKLEGTNQKAWLANGSLTYSASGTLAAVSGTNCKYSLTANKAYTFTFDEDTYQLTVTAVETEPDPEPDPAVSYALYGDFSGSWAEASMTVDGTGAWVGTVTPSNADGAFGIRIYENGKYNNRWLNVATEATISEDNVSVTLQEKTSASAGQDVKYSLSADKAYTFTFNPTSRVLTITWEGATDPEPEPGPSGQAPATLYIFGNINSTGWASNNANALTLSDDGNSFSIVQEIVSSGYFSFAEAKGEKWDDVNNKPRYGATSKDLAVEVGKTYDVKLFSSETDPKAGDCYSWKIDAGTYLFTVDFSTATPTLTIAPEPEPTITLYFKDDNASPWSSVKVYTWDKGNNNKEHLGSFPGRAMTNMSTYAESSSSSTQLWTLTTTVEKPFSGNLGVVFSNGANQNEKTTDFAYQQDNVYYRSGTVTGVNSIFIDGTEGTVSTDVRYFTLQGVPVSNPSAGIYIIVKDGKASKVMIR